METYFASPERSDQWELQQQISYASKNPVINGVMKMVGGLIAVLNQNRQILMVNHGLLKTLGIDNPEKTLGLRPGEALGCRYASEMDAGCGTSEYCMTCGAAIAIVASLGGDDTVERTCAIVADMDGAPSDLYFRVQASPIPMDDNKFILLLLSDITHQQQMAALQRTFFHDINNLIMGLVQASELLRLSRPDKIDDLSQHITGLCGRLASEVELQRNLSLKESPNFQLKAETLSVAAVTSELHHSLSYHPSKFSKSLDIQNGTPGISIHTHHGLLLRVLSNMLINAFEAVDPHDRIRFNTEVKDGQVVFSVWNRSAMASAVSCRVFQRNFSTKSELGRGLGTYSMKLIGEQLLGGHVYFETSPDEGTRFFFELPIHGNVTKPYAPADPVGHPYPD